MIVEQSIHSEYTRKKAHFCNGGLENLDPTPIYSRSLERKKVQAFFL